MLEKMKVKFSNEGYLELEGIKVEEKLISDELETRRDHKGNGLYSEYKIRVVKSKETWNINNRTITVNVTKEYYNKRRPTITRLSDDIMNMLVYENKSIDEIKEALKAI